MFSSEFHSIRSYIHSEFLFVYDVKQCSGFFLHFAVIFPAPFIEEAVFSPFRVLPPLL